MKDESIYITINHLDDFQSVSFLKPGDHLVLKKDKNNIYDDEAIIVYKDNKTKVGYVANSVHSVARGTYSAGKEKINGGTNIYMNIVYIGMGQGYPFNLCYKMDGDSLILVPGNADYGTDVAWDGAVFIPYEMSNIPRQYLN